MKSRMKLEMPWPALEQRQEPLFVEWTDRMNGSEAIALKRSGYRLGRAALIGANLDLRSMAVAPARSHGGAPLPHGP